MQLQMIHNKVFTIRGMRVMIDFHLAELYGVETKALNQGVKRNLKRFPPDFMFQLTAREWEVLKDEIALSSSEADVSILRSQIVTAKSYEGSKRRSIPYVFTEQGVAMLSTVLKSDRAIDVNITIMRAFVILRHHTSNYKELSERIDALERQMNRKFKNVHEALNALFREKATPEIGFKQSGRS